MSLLMNTIWNKLINLIWKLNIIYYIVWTASEEYLLQNLIDVYKQLKCSTYIGNLNSMQWIKEWVGT